MATKAAWCLRTVVAGCTVAALASSAKPVPAEVVAVRHPAGTTHGFLALRDEGGHTIAIGDLIQSVRGERITTRLVFHFRDGSLEDETTIFTQEKVFRLIRDHHIQRGPSFPHPIDSLIDTASGSVSSHSKEKGGKEQASSTTVDVPEDLANGLILALVTNIPPSTAETKVSFLAPGEKPRLVHLSIRPNGEVPFSVGGTQRKATDFLIKVELGGIAGVIAPILGKEPKDIHIWVLEGEAPSFVRGEGQHYEGGPVWKIELISPSYSASR